MKFKACRLLKLINSILKLIENRLLKRNKNRMRNKSTSSNLRIENTAKNELSKFQTWHNLYIKSTKINIRDHSLKDLEKYFWQVAFKIAAVATETFSIKRQIKDLKN